MREVGEEGYTEYTCCLFKAYRTAEDEEFLDAVNDERRKWMLGDVPENYSYKDLLAYALKIYTNQRSLGEWNSGKAKRHKSVKKDNEGEDPKIMALISAVTDIKKRLEMKPGTITNEQDDTSAENGANRNAWRYDNPEGKEKMIRDNHEFKWCSNDCHKKPQWCGRRNCLPRAKYKARRDNNNQAKNNSETGKIKTSEEFKVALSAITSETDFDIFKNRFLN